MDPVLKEAIEAKNSLIKNCNTILISTVSEKNNPNVSYAPTYIDDNCNFYIYISTLAKHTNNMIKTKKISFMILDEKSQNIFAFALTRFSAPGTHHHGLLHLSKVGRQWGSRRAARRRASSALANRHTP